MAKHDYMPLHVAAYIADTQHLSTAEHGAYLLLLMAAWMRGGTLPDDDAKLARLARASGREWGKLRTALVPFFHVEDGEWRQKRLLKELSAAQVRAAMAESRTGAVTSAKWGDYPREEVGRAMRSERMRQAREKGTHTASEWERMRAFHEHKCVRCGSESQEIVRDHIVPVYQGGSDSILNIQPLCRSCNASKGPDSTDFRSPGWEDACIDACRTPAEQASQQATDRRAEGVNGVESLPLSLGLEVPTKPKKKKPLETQIPTDFGVSERVRAWATRKGIEDLEPYLEIFVGRNAASGKTYLDWDQAFMNAIREDWYGIRAKPKKNGNGIIPEWWASEAATKEQGEKLGMTPRGGETWNDFRGRIRERLRSSH